MAPLLQLLLLGGVSATPMGLFVSTQDFGDGSTAYGRTVTAALQLACDRFNASTSPNRITSLALDHLTDAAGAYLEAPLAALAPYFGCFGALYVGTADNHFAGSQSDLYLMLYQVPPCIQSTGPDTVRVAVDVDTAAGKNAVTYLDNAQVGVTVVAEARDGLANAELIEFIAKVLGVTKHQLQLSRGWSAKSKFLLVSNMVAVDVFRKLRAAVDTDLIHVGKVETFMGDQSNELGPAATAGAASSSARKQWEQSEDMQDLAYAPSVKEQTFRN